MSDSTFARNQLLKHGWTEGSGLGREESGMTKAIKVHIKNNKTGVGHDPGAEFTHHWWDHVFNKTAKAIKVGADQNGEVTLSKKSPDSKEEKKAKKKMVLYGNFVKGATLKQEEGRHVEEKEGSSSSESEEETVYKPSEEEVFQRCGGRTAHKGARHGLKLNGKLQRVQAMEAQLMLQMTAAPQQPGVGSSDLHGLDAVPRERKKRKHAEQETESPVENSMAHEDVKKKKKKNKKKRHEDEEVESPVQENLTGNEGVKKKKRKKERHVEEEVESPVEENTRLSECDGKVGRPVETGSPGHEDSHSDGQCPSEGKKKRKKCKKIKESEGEEQACESHHSKKKKKKKRKND
ncbi:G patch domain-containing protein 4-like isoform X2 [Haliotis rubra]|uniref:G patch domain-containing protein 4-like isoform X2 n=1 Tax=Haliotis rubra TaxID=36100 RepID=UPI001EE5F242|nr:G patch domain-containing protein 4-like isoform X2 [Haliotis rubra]